MKKLLSLLLAISIVMTGLVIPVASADVVDPYAIAVPASWELIGEESFLRDPVDDGEGNVTSTFGISTFESDFIEVTALGGYAEADSETPYDKYSYLSNDGLVLSMPKAKTNTSITFEMANGLDLTSDNDYYIMYDLYIQKSNNSGSRRRLWNSDNYVIDTDGAYLLDSGVSSNNSPFTHALQLYRTYLKTDGTQGSGTSQTWVDREHDYNTYNHKWLKVLMQISPRDGKYTLVRERWFDYTAADAEMPTIAPSYWNNATYLDTDTYIGDKLDTIQFSASHNSGSTLSTRVKNFKVYKAPGVNAYITPTLRNDGKTALAANQIQTDAVVSTENAPYTMTMDTVPAGVELVSQGWYDYSDEANPVLLAEGTTINVPASMKNKRLVAKVVVKENGIENTYYPYDGIVRNIVDAVSNVNNNLPNTNTFAAKVTYYKTNADGSLATKTTQTSGNAANANLTYVDWTNATRIDITGQYNVNASVNANDGMVVILLAHYDKDGILKNFIKANPDSTSYHSGPARIGSYTPKSVQTLNAKIVDGSNYDFSTIEPGDTFKCFMWQTTVTPTAVNKKYYYNFEEIIPLSYNLNSDRDKADISGTLLTVPMPVEE